MKQLFTLLICLCVATGVQAQAWSAGVKGGLNLTTIGGDRGDNFTLKPGFNAGLFTEYKLGQNFGIFLDLLYSQKGANFDENQAGLNDARYRMSYIDVPIGFIVYPNAKIGIYAGPQISLLAGAELQTEGDDIDYDNFVANTDYGLVGGVKVWPSLRFSIEARYSYHFSDWSELDDTIGTPDYNEADNDDFHHGVMLSVGYALFMRQ